MFFRKTHVARNCFTRYLDIEYGASIDVVMKIIDVGGKQMVIDRDFSFGIKCVFIM